jgi:hypothetical protein
MTSAVVGAQLGLAGTILGAALGSIIAGVAGTLYTVSLKRTKDRIASAFVGRVGDTKVELTTLSEDAARALSLSKRPATGSGRGGTEDTVEVGGWDWDASATQPAAAAPPSPQPVATAASVDVSGKPAVRLPWKPILVSTAAVFLLAIAGITGFELVSGQAISGGEGTTVTQVGDGGSDRSDAPTDPSSTPTAETSTEPSSEPSASSEPSSSATTEPSAEASQDTEPSASAEPSVSSEPSSSSTPSTGSDDEGVAPSDDQVGADG